MSIIYKFMLSLGLLLLLAACSPGEPPAATPLLTPTLQAEGEDGAAVDSIVVVTPLTQTDLAQSEEATPTPTLTPGAPAEPAPSPTPAPELISTATPTAGPVTPAAQPGLPTAFFPPPSDLDALPESLGTLSPPDEVPSEAETAYLKAVTLYTAGLFEEASASLDEAINLYPEFALAYYHRANLSYTSGNPEEALQDYTQALEIDPTLGPAYEQRADVYANQGQVEAALADYSQAITQAPDRAELYLKRGELLLRQEDYAAALADMAQVLALDPNNARAYLYQGIARKGLGEIERAIFDFSAALELDPALVEAYANRGLAYQALGQPQEALPDYQQVLELSPTPALQADIEALIQGLAPQAGQTTPTTATPQSRSLPLEIEVGQPFVLKQGQAAYLPEADLTLTFEGVEEDSRCPTQVSCVWAGQALVAIAVEAAGSTPDVVVLNTNPAMNEDTATLGAYSLQLVELNPYPEQPDPIPQDEYEVTLVVSGH